MAITESALIRYSVIDGCLRRGGQGYSIVDLVDACNKRLQYETGDTVSKEQVRKDLDRMVSLYDAPIDFDNFVGHTKCFRYTDRTFSIKNSPITDEELHQTRAALSALSRLKGLPQFAWINEILAKLEDKMFMVHDEKAPIAIGFDENPRLEGLNWISPLYNAIINKTPLAISYQPFNMPVINWNIHPYYLKQYNGRWWVFGKNNDYPEGRPTSIAVDRIISIQEADKSISYIENDGPDFNIYFKNVVGTTVPESEPLDIDVRLTPSRFPFVRSKPLHLSQKIVDEKQGVVRIHVIPNPELYSTLASFGKDLEVLSPKHVRLQMKIIAEGMAKFYERL